MVGFGGGSSYLALLSLSEIYYSNIVIVALSCNIVVVLIGAYNFFKNKYYNYKLLIPLISCSIPMAFIGARIQLSEKVFFLILGTCLLFSGFFLLFKKNNILEKIKIAPTLSLLVLGSVLGLISGLVGIGGGIFLMPILLYFNWATTKQSAFTASIFILVNSISGLLGQVIKVGTGNSVIILQSYLPLIFSVIIGGYLGSYMGSHQKFLPSWIEKITAMLILYAGVRIYYLHL